MNEKLKEKTREALTSVLPITVIVLMLSVTLVPMEVGTLALFLTGAVLLIVGMGFFQLGAEISMTPLGQGIGGSIVRQKKTWLAVVICFAMGAIITISEPDLQVLANQVAAIPNAVLIWTVAAGVGVFTAVAVLDVYKIQICNVGDGRAQLFQCALGGKLPVHLLPDVGQHPGDVALVGQQFRLAAAVDPAVILQNHRRKPVNGAEGHLPGQLCPKTGGKAAAHLVGGGHRVGHR